MTESKIAQSHYLSKVPTAEQVFFDKCHETFSSVFYPAKVDCCMLGKRTRGLFRTFDDLEFRGGFFRLPV
jgi:hypothetical protein